MPIRYILLAAQYPELNWYRRKESRDGSTGAIASVTKRNSFCSALSCAGFCRQDFKPNESNNDFANSDCHIIAIKKHGESEVAGHGKWTPPSKMALLFSGFPGISRHFGFPF